MVCLGSFHANGDVVHASTDWRQLTELVPTLNGDDRKIMRDVSLQPAFAQYVCSMSTMTGRHKAKIFSN